MATASADILVGAPGADNNGRVGSGSAYVIFGGAGLSDVDLAALGASGARIDGAAAGESAGWRVAPAGDVNRDGVADILVDTQRGPGQPSVVYVVFGGVGFASLDLARAGAARAIRIVRQRGTSAVGGVDGAGDVNGDGFSDLIVDDTAVPRDQAFVVFGSATPSDVNLAAPAGRAIRILGRPDEEIGSVAGAGDVNGDGFDDVAVGAPFGPGAQGGASGAVDVIRGGARLTDIDLASAGTRATRFLPGVGGLLGSRITGLGDVDGNGVDDLAVGALSANFPSRGTAGSVMVLLGGPRFFRSATRTAAPGGGDILRLVGPVRRGRRPATWAERATWTATDGPTSWSPAETRASKTGRWRGGAWLYGYGATRRCAAVPRPGGRPVEESADPIRLTRQQLLINQRIGQAAIRRIAAVEQRLADGLQDRDVCGGTISAQSLVSTLTPSYGAEIAMPAPAPQPITTAPPSGEPGKVRLTAQQLLINQRIYQAALLRSRSLAERLNGRITGGDLDAGTITRGRFTPGLTLTAAGAATSLPPTGSEARTPERRSGGRVTLSAAQLRINQRIAQVGVRTANDAISQIERGLINGNFADRSIGSEVLAPGVVSSR